MCCWALFRLALARGWLVEGEDFGWFVWRPSQRVTEPFELSFSGDCRDWTQSGSSIYFRVGNVIENIDAQYSSQTLGVKRVELVLDHWRDHPRLAAIEEIKDHDG